MIHLIVLADHIIQVNKGTVQLKHPAGAVTHKGIDAPWRQQVDRFQAGTAAARRTANGGCGDKCHLAHRLRRAAVIHQIGFSIQQPQLSAHQEGGRRCFIHIGIQQLRGAVRFQPPQLCACMAQHILIQPVQPVNPAVKLCPAPVSRAFDREIGFIGDHITGIRGTGPVHLGGMVGEIHTGKSFHRQLLYGLRVRELIHHAHSSIPRMTVSVQGA